MSNETILRYLCAILIVVILMLLFLWRVAVEDAAHYKKLSETNSESLARLTHEHQRLCSKIEKVISTIV